MNTVRFFLFVGVALSLQFPAEANAASIYCVGSTNQLFSAFDAANAEAQGVGQDIRVRTGSYALGASLSFNPAGTKDAKSFSLTGGWNADCTARGTNPANTVLNFTSANSSGRSVELRGDNDRYIVEGIRFEHVAQFTIDDPACPPFGSCPDTEAVTVRYNEFRDGNAFRIDTEDARTLTVQNNLFDGYTGSFGEDLVTIEYENGENKPDVSFNTFAGMQCGGGTAALLHFLSLERDAVLHHNIFSQTGCSYDLYVASTALTDPPVVLRNNLYRSLGGTPPSASSGNLVNVDPGFVDPANNNFNLRTSAPNSAAIDAGMTQIELVLSYLPVPTQDLDGPYNERLIGARYDLGALESAGPPPSEFVVTNTNDSGAGSLRDAILQANLAAGQQRIRFAIAGTCPRKISLSTVLPDITDDLEIDGFSQAGSNTNSAILGNNARLCVVVGPASGTLSYALRVPSGLSSNLNLTLRGIAFTGNHSVAVNLFSGSGHIIQGNAFGGVRPGGIDTLGTNMSHFAARGTAQSVLIGGPDPENRNYFGGSTLNALMLLDASSGGHTVQNNYVGLDPGGAIPQVVGNNGISAQASPNIQILDNVIAGANAGISISGASASNYTIKGNTLGLDAYGGMGLASENNYGIFVSGGSGGHTIGALAGTSRSNIIANSDKAGVWIDASAGAGILVRPNSIYGNGKSGLGLGIDLGTLGPSPNDPLDADGGPNSGQNAPQISAAIPNANGTRQAVGRLNSLAGANFRIDIYRSPTCPDGNRGGDAKTRLAAVDVVTGTGSTAGIATFSVAVSGVGSPGYLSAIATRTASEDTSEIGPCFFEDTLFKDGFESSIY